MHNHLHEDLARLHQEDLMVAAHRARLRAVVRTTRRPPRSLPQPDINAPLQ
jgi:hypothetical protein